VSAELGFAGVTGHMGSPQGSLVLEADATVLSVVIRELELDLLGGGRAATDLTLSLHGRSRCHVGAARGAVGARPRARRGSLARRTRARLGSRDAQSPDAPGSTGERYRSAHWVAELTRWLLGDVNQRSNDSP